LLTKGEDRKTAEQMNKQMNRKQTVGQGGSKFSNWNIDKYRKVDRQTERQTDRPTDRLTDRQTDGRTYGQTEGKTKRQVNGLTVRHRQTNNQKDR
jgi:hypothetical protein